MKRTLSERRAEVMSLMSDGQKRTRNQIADALKWRSGPVCGRVNELLHQGLLKVVGNYFDPDTEAYSQLIRTARLKRKTA